MLVNLSPKRSYRTNEERFTKYLNKHNRDVNDGNKWIPRKFSDIFEPTDYTGVYWTGLNANHEVDMYTKQRLVYESKKYSEIYWSIPRDRLMDLVAYEKNVFSYGVADNLEQVVALYNNNEDGWFKGNHVIFCTKILKDPTEPCSGWRWHKWGGYIGTRDPQCEYLNDEPDIDEVVVFCIYKVI